MVPGTFGLVQSDRYERVPPVGRVAVFTVVVPSSQDAQVSLGRRQRIPQLLNLTNNTRDT
jgi:hypothetical protein